MMTETEYASITVDEADGLLGEHGKDMFHIHTLGCQMNVHDFERIAGALEVNGYVSATENQINDNDLDLLALNACAACENAAERTYGTVGRSNRIELVWPNLQVAIGGCMAQPDRKKIADTAPWVPAAFSIKNTEDLPRLLDQNRAIGRAQVQVTEQLWQFPSQLPAVRASRISSWVAISVGCNNTYTFCIVPTTRGKEGDRRPGDILDEARQCVASDAKEVTLLGQNVNLFGYGIGDRYALSKLLHACSIIDGLERVCFTLPYPAALIDDVIAMIVETSNIIHQLYFPLQSGSNRVLRVMHRPYRPTKFLDILGRIRAVMPDAQIFTDIVVGFSGETKEDFQQTMDVVRRARFPSAFMFIYSPRPGTPAAAMEQIPRGAVQGRFDRLVALQEQTTEESLAIFEGRNIEVMITGKLDKKDTDAHRVASREKTGVLVHISVPEGRPVPEIDDLVMATVTHAGHHNLLANPDMVTGQTYSVRY